MAAKDLLFPAKLPARQHPNCCCSGESADAIVEIDRRPGFPGAHLARSFAGELRQHRPDRIATGSGRYVFEISSSRRPANHPSSPFASIAAKFIPSTPGAPALVRANA